jgi:hypothetical protein
MRSGPRPIQNVDAAEGMDFPSMVTVPLGQNAIILAVHIVVGVSVKLISRIVGKSDRAAAKNGVASTTMVMNFFHV